MKILLNQSLKKYNTFWIDVYAKRLCFLENIDDLKEFMALEWVKTIIGWGSNILICGDQDLIWINICRAEPSILEESEHWTYIKVESGYNWDAFVQWALEHSCFWLENMGLIPGTVGAGALGNIWAYGKEISEFIYEIEYIDLKTLKKHRISNNNCNFSYRRSVFKEMSDYFISSITFQFNNNSHSLNPHYPDVQTYLAIHGINQEDLSPKKLYQIICEIRASKMPSRDEWWTAGSFFKNPIVDKNTIDRILLLDPELKYFPHENEYKLAAGYLLEKLGYRWKIIRTPSWWSVGCYKNQALLVVNNGASGEEVDSFASELEKLVWDFYGVRLEREVVKVKGAFS